MTDSQSKFHLEYKKVDLCLSLVNLVRRGARKKVYFLAGKKLKNLLYLSIQC